MDLFTTIDQNLLPCDGTALLYGFLCNQEQSNYYYTYLLHQIRWQKDKANIFGKTVYTNRMVAWYGCEKYQYTYSNCTKTALPWTKELLAIKKLVEEQTGETYNSCLLNLYHDGEEGMAWHSDGEATLKKNGAIASVSFGTPRKFSFKHKEQALKVDVILDHGTLLVMKDEIQTYWLHRLPLVKHVKTPRINLTFRTIEK